jgi:hypothetical protein
MGTNKEINIYADCSNPDEASRYIRIHDKDLYCLKKGDPKRLRMLVDRSLGTKRISAKEVEELLSYSIVVSSGNAEFFMSMHLQEVFSYGIRIATDNEYGWDVAEEVAYAVQVKEHIELLDLSLVSTNQKLIDGARYELLKDILLRMEIAYGTDKLYGK